MAMMVYGENLYGNDGVWREFYGNDGVWREFIWQ